MELDLDLIPGTTYKIYQSDRYFKYGVDAILLSSFAKMKEEKSLVDIGTGVGILALRCHYLYKPSMVYGFEIQENLAAIARKSVKENEIDNIEIIGRDVREGFGESVDYIITNPPYIEKRRAIENSARERLIAFHELSLNLDDIFSFAKSNLKDRGRLFMVNRVSRMVDVLEKARAYRIEPTRIRLVASYKGAKPHLFLLECVKNAGKNFVVEENLYIYKEDRTHTEEIKEMYYGKG